ncbi:MAG: hypothetical protein K1X89_07280 [Myxococcaceae bacterium]|nr:hypothetical protein [Myxococcaceae bacterium]
MDPVLAQLSRGRVHLGPFEVDEVPTQLDVTRASALHGERAQPLSGSQAPWGYVACEGRELRALIPDDVWAAESVLRLAWQRLTVEQGGVLMHGSAVGFGAGGVAAIGQSGAGKSTLAALCAHPPGRATLLTDEIVQLLPDGTLFGSPFRSNHENVGAPGPVALRGLLLLEKGNREALTPVGTEEACAVLFAQLFWVPFPGAPAVSELRRRVLALIASVGVFRLTFRKDVAVGAFLRDWVASR